GTGPERDRTGRRRASGAGPRGHARTRRAVRRRPAGRPIGERRVPRPCDDPERQRGSMSIRILIADDQSLVRTGFRMILDAEPDLDVVGEAVDGREAVDKARAAKPDVILMDIRMPELDGIEATRRIIADAGEEAPKILMLTTFDL